MICDRRKQQLRHLLYFMLSLGIQTACGCCPVPGTWHHQFSSKCPNNITLRWIISKASTSKTIIISSKCILKLTGPFCIGFRMLSADVKFFLAPTRSTKIVPLLWFKMECKYPSQFICLKITLVITGKCLVDERNTVVLDTVAGILSKIIDSIGWGPSSTRCRWNINTSLFSCLQAQVPNMPSSAFPATK